MHPVLVRSVTVIPMTIVQHRKRLKSLDEFETPEFVGRMERVRRLRVWLWRLMLVVAIVVGVLVGLLLF